MNGKIISLNVGGSIFTTTVATLTQYPDSMLAAMFDPESERPPAVTDKEGNFFIDRDPKPFEVILSFLRSARLRENLLSCTLEEVEWEADYYGLKELLKIVEQRKDEGPKMTLLECEEKAVEMRKKIC